MTIRIYHGPKTYRDAEGKVRVTDNPLSMGAQIAKDARLYVPGWTMIDSYESILEGESRHWEKSVVIAIKFIGAVPIAIVWCDVDYDYQAFCKPHHRRKGHCTELIRKIHDWCMSSNLPYIQENYNGEQMCANAGAYGSLEFWEHISDSVVPIDVDYRQESFEIDKATEISTSFAPTYADSPYV